MVFICSIESNVRRVAAVFECCQVLKNHPESELTQWRDRFWPLRLMSWHGKPSGRQQPFTVST